MAQSVEHLTLELGSGHDLTVYGFEPHIGLCTDSVEPSWDSLSASLSLTLTLCPYPAHMCSLFLKINKFEKRNQGNVNTVVQRAK